MKLFNEYGEPTNQGYSVAGGCLVLLVGVILFFVTSYHQVGSTEIAVTERFGNITGERTSGVHIDLFTGYTYYDTKIQSHSSTQAAATDDLQDINVDLTVNYKVKPDKITEIYKNIGDQNSIKIKALDPQIAQALKSVSTKYSGEELVQKRNEVGAEVEKLLIEKLAEYNIEVVDVSLTNMTFTNPDFNAAIDRKQIAEQDTLKAQYELEKSKIDAEKSKAQQTSLTPEILQKMWLDKWNGQLPTTMYVTDDTAKFLLPAK